MSASHTMIAFGKLANKENRHWRFSLFAGAPRRIAFAAAEAGRTKFAYGEGHGTEQ